MNIANARTFIENNARPIEKAVYSHFFVAPDIPAVLQQLAPYQNPDGGFGNALEPDNWNPASTPITTNDAIATLFSVGALRQSGTVASGLARYLKSGADFDSQARRWLFATEANAHYPHAVWWEKNGDGLSGYNPTVSLAAFMVCMGEKEPFDGILREAFDALEHAQGHDALKCYILACDMLEDCGVTDLVDIPRAKEQLRHLIWETICKDTEKYGIEYVASPSVFFQQPHPDLTVPEMLPLIGAELERLDELQLEDGGFDIAWQWYNGYPEFAQARAWWRPRVTLEKLRFATSFTRVRS